MPDAIGSIGFDPNQIRLQLSDAWNRGDESAGMSAESFSQVMWQTVLKETLKLDFMGTGEGGGFSQSMYGDWVKEGFTSAIAAQLAKQNPLPMPGAETTGGNNSI